MVKTQREAALGQEDLSTLRPLDEKSGTTEQLDGTKTLHKRSPKKSAHLPEVTRIENSPQKRCCLGEKRDNSTLMILIINIKSFQRKFDHFIHDLLLIESFVISIYSSARLLPAQRGHAG